MSDNDSDDASQASLASDDEVIEDEDVNNIPFPFQRLESQKRELSNPLSIAAAREFVKAKKLKSPLTEDRFLSKFLGSATNRKKADTINKYVEAMSKKTRLKFCQNCHESDHNPKEQVELEDGRRTALHPKNCESCTLDGILDDPIKYPSREQLLQALRNCPTPIDHVGELEKDRRGRKTSIWYQSVEKEYRNLEKKVKDLLIEWHTYIEAHKTQIFSTETKRTKAKKKQETEENAKEIIDLLSTFDE